MIFLYFTTGIGGMLLSAIYKPESFAIGCSTSVFGLVGYYVSYVITGWWYMGRQEPGQRIYLTILTSLIIYINSNLGTDSSNADNYGHLGGLITGILSGFAICEFYDRQALLKGRVPDRYSPEQYDLKSRLYCNNILLNYLGTYCLLAYFTGGFYYLFKYVDVSK